MRQMTARELKARTGEALEAVASGDRVLITRHGRPLAVLVPYQEAEVPPEGVRPFDTSWPEIEEALRRHPSPFATWREAMNVSRRRR